MESHHPLPFSGDSVSEQPPSRSVHRVHLSWEPLFPEISAIDIDINNTDVYYQLYCDALQYLRKYHSAGWPSCRCVTELTNLIWAGIEDIPRRCQGFGTLVNLMVDKFSDLDELSLETFLSTYDPNSVVDFLVFGVLVVHIIYNTLSSYTQVRRPEGTLRNNRDNTALWLSAMTFGLLEAVTRVRIPESVLVVPSGREGKQVLSGSRIRRFLTHFWMSKRREDDKKGQLEHGHQIVQLVKRALRALDEEVEEIASILMSGGYTGSGRDVIVGAVAFTVLPLYHIACKACAEWRDDPVMQDLASELGTLTKSRPFHLASIRFCRHALPIVGWCPNTISSDFLAKFMNLTWMSTLLQLPPYIRTSETEHKDCTEDACVFYTIANTEAYVPRHVDPACHCEYIRPPIEEIIGMLNYGIVPAVVYDGGRLHVQPATEGSYVAISHVWADGMGSTTEDGLPICVVVRIASLARGLHPETGAFWMDSLPTVTRRAFSSSTTVSVRNAQGKKSWEENLLRIATSGWIRRVWTLQEGLLNRNLYFEFEDGPTNVEYETGLKKAGSTTDTVYVHAWAPHETPSHWSLPQAAIFIWCMSHVPLIAFRTRYAAWKTDAKLDEHELISLLSLRSTTKAEDETVAISGLLSLDVGALLAITGPDAAPRRMREFLLQLFKVPIVLAVHATPRLRLPGFLWAPRELRRVPPAGFRTDSGPKGICTAFGLVAEYFVAPLREPYTHDLRRRDSTDASRDYFEVLHAHHEPSGTWFASTQIEAGESHCITFDALLFVDDVLPTNSLPVSCAAVCSVGPTHTGDYRAKASQSWCQKTPTSLRLPQQEFRHVASVVLTMLHMSSAIPRGYTMASRDVAWMGELSKGVLLLT
ncbi:hypothetical protein TRAPUB_11094 [Trametes pubescens]|uniref:Heterokaryon incompatibility domain-containing protein n=1 Tax=Trametes pubescens TaxID=154538 RepID=A0A1M2VXI9_TRAPU|nr:hypothetical protein TRAPUB_11094 [Trametes pubescens]